MKVFSCREFPSHSLNLNKNAAKSNGLYATKGDIWIVLKGFYLPYYSHLYTESVYMGGNLVGKYYIIRYE